MSAVKPKATHAAIPMAVNQLLRRLGATGAKQTEVYIYGVPPENMRGKVRRMYSPTSDLFYSILRLGPIKLVYITNYGHNQVDGPSPGKHAHPTIDAHLIPEEDGEGEQ